MPISGTTTTVMPAESDLDASNEKTIFHHITQKDESLFIGVIVVGVIVPALIISIITLFCIQKHKERRARRADQLLQNAQETSMEDFPYTVRSNSLRRV